MSTTDRIDAIAERTHEVGCRIPAVLTLSPSNRLVFECPACEQVVGRP